MARLAGLAGERSGEAAAWLAVHFPAIDQAAQSLRHVRGPYAVLHLDTRSDNVRVHPRAPVPLRMFDWPFAAAGPPELDLIAFVQSIVCEGGPHPETMVRWYAAVQPVPNAPGRPMSPPCPGCAPSSVASCEHPSAGRRNCWPYPTRGG